MPDVKKYYPSNKNSPASGIVGAGNTGQKSLSAAEAMNTKVSDASKPMGTRKMKKGGVVKSMTSRKC